MIALVLALAVFAGLAIGPAIRADREAHLIHRAGCKECEDQ